MKIIDKYFNIFGYDFHIRIVPNKYTKQVSRIHDMIEAELYDDARVEIDNGIAQWGQDIDLLSCKGALRLKLFKKQIGK